MTASRPSMYKDGIGLLVLLQLGSPNKFNCDLIAKNGETTMNLCSRG